MVISNVDCIRYATSFLFHISECAENVLRQHIYPLAQYDFNGKNHLKPISFDYGLYANHFF